MNLLRKSYLADINEIRFFQIHVQFDQHSQNLISELLVLHQGHAHLQAVGKKAAHVILQNRRRERKKLSIYQMLQVKCERHQCLTDSKMVFSNMSSLLVSRAMPMACLYMRSSKQRWNILLTMPSRRGSTIFFS